jgi:hypothetical protein
MGPNLFKSTENIGLRIERRKKDQLFSKSLKFREVRERGAGGADRDRTGDLLTAS